VGSSSSRNWSPLAAEQPAAAVIAGVASGVYNSPQQAAVADIIGKARGGPAIATFQMMSDFGSIVGSFGVGVLAQQLSYGWAFGISGAILLLAGIGWMFAPETRDQSPVEHTPARPLGPEAAGEARRLGPPRLPLHRPGQDAGQRRGDHGPAGDHLVQGRDQLVGLHVLEQIAAGPALEGTNEVLLIRAGGEHGHVPGGIDPAQLPQDLDPPGPGHAQVEQHHIRCLDLGQAQPLRTVAHRVDHPDATPLQEFAQPGPEQSVIVDEQDAQHAAVARLV